jgi:hypothetical protein
MPNHRDWLRAEQSGQDELAETMFARMVAEMPAVEPGADFVGRTVQTVWRARARRRVVVRVARVAAALLFGAATLGSMYALSVLAGGFIVRGAAELSHGFAWLVASIGEGARWWWIAERIGTAVGVSVSSPLTAAAIATAEMIALLAMYAFRRLVWSELGTRESRKVRT